MPSGWGWSSGRGALQQRHQVTAPEDPRLKPAALPADDLRVTERGDERGAARDVARGRGDHPAEVG